MDIYKHGKIEKLYIELLPNPLGVALPAPAPDACLGKRMLLLNVFFLSRRLILYMYNVQVYIVCSI